MPYGKQPFIKHEFRAFSYAAQICVDVLHRYFLQLLPGCAISFRSTVPDGLPELCGYGFSQKPDPDAHVNMSENLSDKAGRLHDCQRLDSGSGLHQVGENGKFPHQHLPDLIRVAFKLIKGAFAAVYPVVDAGVKIPAKQPADGDNQHAIQGHVAVDRAQTEVAMKKYCHWPQYAEQHVGLEPVADRAPGAHEPDTLAQRIEQQHQHHAATDDAKGVARPVFCVNDLHIPVLPSGIDEKGHKTVEQEARTDIGAGQVFFDKRWFLSLACHG